MNLKRSEKLLSKSIRTVISRGELSIRYFRGFNFLVLGTSSGRVTSLSPLHNSSKTHLLETHFLHASIWLHSMKLMLGQAASSALPRRGIDEETANQLTHGVGFLLSLVGTGVLLLTAYGVGDSWVALGCTVYGVTLVALYAASTLSHSFHRPQLREFFRTLDQVCIFLLIAGNFTPVALVHLRHDWWPCLLIAMWGLAFAGIVFKVFFRRLRNVAVSAYVLLGWLPIIAINEIINKVHGTGFAWILAGGAFYMAGTVFLALDQRVKYFHAVWHLLVIAGSACHYIVVLFFVAG